LTGDLNAIVFSFPFYATVAFTFEASKVTKNACQCSEVPFHNPTHQKTVSLPVRIRQAEARLCWPNCNAPFFDQAGKGIDGRNNKASAILHYPTSLTRHCCKGLVIR